MGAQVVLTRSDVAKGHPDYYQDMAERIARETPGRLLHQPVRQPRQPGRARVRHRPGDPARRWTRSAAGRHRVRLRQLRHHDRPVALLRRSTRRRSNWSWPTRSARSSPNTSTKARSATSPASWMVEGIGEDFLPPISDFTRVKKAYAISDKESFLTARELLEKEGILGGSSTGTLLAAALKILPRADHAEEGAGVRLRHRQQVPVEDVQRLLDAGQRLPRARTQHGDLRDLILRPYSPARHGRGRPRPTCWSPPTSA